eukprot:TRINITY_DN10448_c0_g1_i2.p1 TRINITY_DN10448_c0_g1~~TRINITY_DN10448_c0_g1_i2.p1  ORF type:complete len:367 (+),score=29.36 TRINITY_DN10448_c0_g1_i2:93-1193(+)
MARIFSKWLILLVVVTFITYLFRRSNQVHSTHQIRRSSNDYNHARDGEQNWQRHSKSEHDLAGIENVHVALVACGSQSLDYVEAMLNSIHYFARGVKITVYLLSDQSSRAFDHASMTIHWRNVSYPKQQPGQPSWQGLFKPCASQRLFLPDVLQQVEKVIYLDADVLVLSNIVELWRQFDSFNSTQTAAMVPEGEDLASNWYRHQALHPYYGQLGLNSGVMLMHLARLRQADFSVRMGEILNVYKDNITWGDQDLLNIYYAQHPEALLELDCSWNFRPDHCQYGMDCDTKRVKILHGNRGVFVNTKDTPNVRPVNIVPSYKAVFDSFRQLPFQLSDVVHDLRRYSQGEDAGALCAEAILRTLTWNT